MTDHKALIAEARRYRKSVSRERTLLHELASALESASADRAVVEAQALEALADKYAWASSVRVADIRARAVEIREGRQ